MSVRFVWVWAVTLVLAVLSGPGMAQTLSTGGSEAPAAVEVPEDLTPELVRDLVAGLTDAQIRQLLLERLDAVAEAQQAAAEEASEAGANLFYHATTGAVQEIIISVKKLPVLFERQPQAFAQFFETFGGSGILQMLGFFAIILAAGFAAEFVVNRLTRRWHLTTAENDTEAPRRAVTTLAKKLCRDLLGVFVFVAVARTVAFSVLPPAMLPYGGIILFNLVALPRIAVALAGFLLSPRQPEYRFVNTDDRTARFLSRHILGFSLLVGFMLAILEFNAINGLEAGATRLGFWLNLAVHLYIVWMAWQARNGLVEMMRGADDDVSAVEERVSRAYPWFAIAVSVGTWWLVNILVSYQAWELLGSAPHFKSMALLLLAPAMDTAVRGIVKHLMPEMSGEGVIAERAHIAAERSWVRIGRVIVFGLVIIQIANFWGMSPVRIATGAVGEQFAASIIEFLIVVATGYLAWEVVSLVVNRQLAAEMTASGAVPDEEAIGGDGGGAGGSRLSTVLPLILLAAHTAIAVLFALIALSALGIDTTPLLAGAGIAGLAIGFGAQKLVTDVVSGIFFLVDDAFRVGEYVEVGDTKGTVEKISVRSMQLRHHRGLVHTLPYGEIPKITNYSRDWVIMKLKFTVPFDTDPEKVRKLFKKIGQEVQAMDLYKDDMLQPFKSQGVFDFDDVGMVIRGKFMARPGSQFMMRKEIYNRVKAVFDANGIEFARREVRVNVNADEDAADTDTVAGAAASGAVQAGLAGQQGGAGGDTR
ncbi:mechanosensitive ion channel family protein [Roseobacter sp. S98]|uniref:mechanosensitive ion channel family protein n=1 Tax=Roseobacter algicola (ex Choi et al. 2025) (nom. illeg.) TaxID=3092138 RepID=UPI003F514978